MRLTILLTLFLISSTTGNFIECEVCKTGIKAIQDIAYDKTLWDIATDIGVLVCYKFVKQTWEVCEGAVREMAPVVLDSLIQHFIDPQSICYQQGSCTSPKIVFQDFDAWQKQVLQDKPDLPWPTPTNKETFKFGHMSDIHMDFFYKEGSNTHCGLPLCCRDWNGKGDAGLFGDYECDVPLRTVQEAMSQIAALDIDFLIWTGDIPPHDVWNQSKEYVLSFQKQASVFLQKYFPDTPIFTIFGNHGCYPVNVYDPANASWLLDPYAEIFSKWLSESAKEDVMERGTFSIQYDEKLRMIATNSQACNNMNFNLWANVTDPQGQIGWLIQELKAAEFKGEKVYIFTHIPVGNGDCLSTWANHMNTIIDRFSGTILGQFYGHTHEDHFYVSRSISTGEPVSVQWVAPSVTTYQDKNPSFRVYEADKETKVVTNIHQYRLNLPEANKLGKAEFELAYSMKQEYGLEDLTPASMAEFAKKLQTDEETAVKWYNNKHSGGPGPMTSCDQSCRDGIYCGVAFGTADEGSKCSGSKPSLQDKLFAIFFGKWRYKVYQSQ